MNSVKGQTREDDGDYLYNNEISKTFCVITPPPPELSATL
jgi:hypothetical protein